MFIDHPKTGIAHFPEDFSEISKFRYETGLSLLRLQNAAKLRIGEDAEYIVGADYTVTFTVDDEETKVTVPAGLVTDLASVPLLLRWLVGRVGPHLEAAIVHDYLYVAWRFNGRGVRRKDRRFADAVMLAGMRAADVNPIFRTFIYWSLRLFGNWAYTRENTDLFVDLTDPAIIAQFPNAAATPTA